MPTYRCWLVRYGRQEWELIQAPDYESALKLAGKKYRAKLKSVATEPVPSKDAA